MQTLDTFLLREKFIIRDLSVKNKTEDNDIVAASNRIVLNLVSQDFGTAETIIVRAQNMHLCTRMAARIFQSFRQGGTILERTHPFDWRMTWRNAFNEFEEYYNDRAWCVVYNKGKRLFHYGEYHPFLDLIEKCEEQNTSDYENSVRLAENAFKAKGRDVEITYKGNVALVVDLKKEDGRFGIILRSSDKETTFNFRIKGNQDKPLNFAQCLNVSAAFLEGVQLTFKIGFEQERFRRGLIERRSKEEKYIRAARKRLSDLNSDIIALENSLEVNYRPEKPDFDALILDSEQRAKAILYQSPPSN